MKTIVMIAIMLMVMSVSAQNYTFKRDAYNQNNITATDSYGNVVAYYSVDPYNQYHIDVYDGRRNKTGYMEVDRFDKNIVTFYSADGNRGSRLEIPSLTGLFDPVPYKAREDKDDWPTQEVITPAFKAKVEAEIEESNRLHAIEYKKQMQETDRLLLERKRDRDEAKSKEDQFVLDTEKAEHQYYMVEISNHTKDIENNPNNSYAYCERGTAKSMLEDYRGAVLDFTKAMTIDPRLTALCSFDRGNAKACIGDQLGAIADFSKFIEINPEDNRHMLPMAYGNRGLAKLKINQKESGCLDLSKAGELGLDEAYEVIKKYCK